MAYKKLIAAAAGVSVGTYAAAGATTVVAGTTAAAGAIATKTVATSSGTIVYSLVPASIGMKILLFGTFALATCGIAYTLLTMFDDDKKD